MSAATAEVLELIDECEGRGEPGRVNELLANALRRIVAEADACGSITSRRVQGKVRDCLAGVTA